MVGKISGTHVPLWPCCFQAKRRLHERADLVGEEAGVLVEALQLLAVVFRQFRLVVPGVDLAGPAVHEQPDDRFRLRGEMRRPGGERIEAALRGFLGGEEAFALQEAGQGEGAATAAGSGQEGTAGAEGGGGGGEQVGDGHGRVSSVIFGCWKPLTAGPMLL